MFYQGVLFEVMQHLMDCGNILSKGCVEISDKTFHFLSLFQQIHILHLILLINFDRVKISQKAQCYIHQLIKSFPVIYILYIFKKIYF